MVHGDEKSGSGGKIKLILETEAKIHRVQEATSFVWYMMEAMRDS
ncbi:hypothetical protein [Paenibacillus spongiae]|nr:hypothetical protein [Paenibacillus spongiae]